MFSALEWISKIPSSAELFIDKKQSVCYNIYKSIEERVCEAYDA